MECQPYPAHPVLVVDDEVAWLRCMALSLRGLAGIDHVLTCADSRQVADILREREVSLVLLDLTMPHVSGEELLAHITRDHPGIPVIILTGLNQVEIAVRCMRLGAYDFFVKTGEEERLMAGVRRALALVELRQENAHLGSCVLRGGVAEPAAFAPIVTRSPKLQAIFRYLEAIARSPEPLLITGESGVGKELIAKSLHRLCAPGGPWVAVNVAGLDEAVFSDTLFGHGSGAFTGADRVRPGMVEAAAGGILFLDEIGDLGLSSQVKLLRLLQEREYLPLGSDRPRRSQARVVVSTNQDLDALVGAGRFRHDLYYRLYSHRVQVPPLRERSEDLAPLLDHFLREAAGALGKELPEYPPALCDLLAGHDFPGNVRELRALVYDAVSLHSGGVLSLESFRSALVGTPCERAHQPPAEPRPAVGANPFADAVARLPTLQEAGRQLVDAALERTGGNQSAAAGLLGISRQALSKRLKKYNNA